MKRLINKIVSHFTRPDRNSVILMYHQVTKRSSDPWSLAVSPEYFDQQMLYLKKNYDVLPLRELAETIRKKKIKKPVVAITFDDGFEDNFTTALPILEQYNLPATFFVSTDLVGGDRGYWWDELEELVFHTNELPEILAIKVRDLDFQFRFLKDRKVNAALEQQIKGWNCEAQPVNERIEVFIRLWRLMQPLSSVEQQSILRKIRAQIGSLKSNHHQFRVMSVEQLRQLSKKTMYEIGAHTVSHPMLSQHHASFQRSEINESKRIIGQWTGRSTESFAYPYGNFDQHTKEIVRESGFSLAVSTAESGVETAADLFSLPRVQVKNWNPDKFNQRLKSLQS
jgi:peptidoglycan/xylan/chitin deacetylase (PgdA/CDA1 family)